MESAFAKLSRAKVHRDTLRTDVEAYRARDPHDWVLRQTDHLFDPSRAVLRVVVKVKEQKPDNWGLIVGDILTNLRAALDHAVYEHAAGRVTLTPKQEKDLNYPIITIPTDWPNQRARLTPFVDSAVLQVIEDSQPFKATKGLADWHALALLNGLVNRDKHRAVRTVAYMNEEFTVTHSKLDIIKLDTTPCEMTDGAVVATATVRLPDPSSLTPQQQKEAGWRLAPLDVVSGYIENIDLPKVGAQQSVLFVMDTLVGDVESLLNDLKAAGC